MAGAAGGGPRLAGRDHALTVMALRPSERLTATVLLLLLGVAVLLRPGGWFREALALAGLLGVLGLLPRTRRRSSALLRDFAPIGMVLGIFLLLQPLVAGANPHRWDVGLAGLDARALGPLAARWRGAFGRPPAFTDLMYAAYASFYVLPLAVAALSRARLGPDGFERVTFTLLLGFYLSFLGYFLCPAEGPRVASALEARVLGGGPLSGAVRTFLRLSERTTLDAFPSGHTALSVLAAWLGTRSFPRRAPLFWLWGLAIVFATVYLSLHYVVDVAAGILLAPLTLVLAGPLARVFGDRRSGIRTPEEA